MNTTYKYIDHTADLGIEVYGKTLEELFINIGKAIFETQISGKVEEITERKIKLKSESLEDLFIDWCRELLYNFTVNEFIPKTYKLSVSNFSLKAHLFGQNFNNKKHKVRLEIKNPTYHNLQIKKTKQGYQATIIFDV
jgi:SHS2 domain-containing protein